MMKAAVVTAFKKPLEVKEVPIPKPGPNDVLVKHIACGVCHTDLHAAHGDWDVKPELPRIPGHEGVGEIVELGSMVADHLKKGDIVGIPWLHASCLHCEFCLTGRETLCKQQVNSGYSCDGSFGEYALMDANFAVKLPEGMDPYKSAPLYCAGVTVYKALKVSQVKPGQWVSIVGVGGLGSVAVKYAVAMGMRVATVVAPNDKTAVQLSKDFGAEVVFDGPPDQHGQWMQEHTGGVHGAVITVPIVSAFEQAFQSVRRGGRVVAVALPNGKMAVPIVDCVLGGIELVGSIVGTRQDLRECLEIAKLHKIECKVQKRKLEEINEIFDDMLHYRISGRVVIDYTAK